MSTPIMQQGSLWSATADLPMYPSLASNLTVEVCIVGGGIAGLTTAYLLARSGLSVALLEALELGCGETSHTTAHIAVPDDRYWHIQDSYGREAARQTADSYAAAIELIESIVRDEQLECEFSRVDGYLFSCAKDPRAALEREFSAATYAGVRITKEERLPGFGTKFGPLLRFPDQAQFHPLQYLAGLARAVQRRRGAIYCGTRALSIDESSNGAIVRSATGKIIADAVVVATNTPFNDRVAIHVKQNSYQSYVVAALLPRDALPRQLLWDDADPYHYVRIARAGDDVHDLLIVGGEDHKTGQEPQPQFRYRALEAWLREQFPQAGPIAYRWSGQVMEPLDGIAYLGRNPGSDSVYVITGDSGNGITHATVGAMLVSDLIMGRQNPWLNLYDPSRKPLKEALHFIREQSNIVAQYSDWISNADISNATEIAPGEGALLRARLRKLAVYRDEDGALHAHSAACPHLGCVVQWNAAEKTWDCPCHGSRFNAYGGVLHGPAVAALAPVDAEELAEISGLSREAPGEERRPKA